MFNWLSRWLPTSPPAVFIQNVRTIYTVLTTTTLKVDTILMSIAAQDVRLVRDAPGILGIKNGTTAQGLRVFLTSSGADETYLRLQWVSNVARIEPVSTGAAPARNMLLQAGNGGVELNGAGVDLTNGAGSTRVRISSTGLAVLVTNGGLTHGNAASLVTTSVALNNGAGAGVGTLANAPAAGDPTKWIPVNDNGTVRYVPAW